MKGNPWAKIINRSPWQSTELCLLRCVFWQRRDKTKSQGAVRLLHIFLTVGHLPTQQGTVGDNYNQTPDEQGTPKRCERPHENNRNQFHVAKRQISKRAQIFPVTGLSPADRKGTRPLSNKQIRNEKVSHHNPLLRVYILTLHRVKRGCVFLVYTMLFQFTSHPGSKLTTIIFLKTYVSLLFTWFRFSSERKYFICLICASEAGCERQPFSSSSVCGRS